MSFWNSDFKEVVDYVITYLVVDDRNEGNPRPFVWQQLNSLHQKQRLTIIDCMARDITNVLFEHLPASSKMMPQLFGLTLNGVKESISSIHGIGLPANFMGELKGDSLVKKDWITLVKTVGEFNVLPKLLYSQDSKNGKNGNKQDGFNGSFWSHGDYFHFYVRLSMKELPAVYETSLKRILAICLRPVIDSTTDKSDGYRNGESEEKSDHVTDVAPKEKEKEKAINKSPIQCKKLVPCASANGLRHRIIHHDN